VGFGRGGWRRSCRGEEMVDVAAGSVTHVLVETAPRIVPVVAVVFAVPGPRVVLPLVVHGARDQTAGAEEHGAPDLVADFWGGGQWDG
jgi:hypothetical protein